MELARNARSYAPTLAQSGARVAAGVDAEDRPWRDGPQQRRKNVAQEPIRLNDIRLGWSGVAHRTIDDTGRRFPLTMGLEGVMCGS